MTPTSFSSAVRRLWPRRMRSRLAVFYTVLFLLAGVVLLALTYTLAAAVLLPAAAPAPKLLPPQERALMALCKPLPTSPSLLAKCNHLIDIVGAGPKAHGDELAALRFASVIGLGILVIAAAGLGWLASGRALRPVRSITEAARRASELRLGQRLAFTGPDDEFKQLADTFDVMLERLDAAFTSQKRFVANAAHELRTPLTAMRTAIEVTLSKPTRTPEQLEAMATRVKRSVERAEATIEALLTLATSEVGPGANEAIDLATAAEDALDGAQPAIDQRGIKVDAVLEPAPARGDRVLVERMIANLVENAVRHNNPAGWIGVRTRQQVDSAVFEIANTGPTVPAEEIPTLFEPFARAEQRLNSNDGVGLGLSIASAIARAHSTTITARPRPGGGLEISVAIPTSRPDRVGADAPAPGPQAYEEATTGIEPV
ncbi:MAG TPA: HAMP domain-containing sensor histidine kinase [Solirubrobacteraceae bacterium]|nr:HAMP domain-containing sensor histidine kinase [Solirubrobacteraceae bacterium]